MALPMSPTPQIFTNGRRATLAGSVGDAPARDERPCRRDRVGRAHQRLADERAIEALRPPARDRGGVADAGFGDDETVVGDEVPKPAGALRIDDERSQVAVVDADEPRVGLERQPELALVVRLDERLETEGERPLHERAQATLRRVQDRQQQHGVGAGRPQQLELARVDDELLGQDRDGDGGADGPQVVDRPTEPVRLAQDRDRRRAAGLIGASAGDDVLAAHRRSARPRARRA